MIRAELLGNRKGFAAAAPARFGEQLLLLHRDVAQEPAAEDLVRLVVDDQRVPPRSTDADAIELRQIVERSPMAPSDWPSVEG